MDKWKGKGGCPRKCCPRTNRICARTLAGAGSHMFIPKITTTPAPCFIAALLRHDGRRTEGPPGGISSSRAHASTPSDSVHRETNCNQRFLPNLADQSEVLCNASLLVVACLLYTRVAASAHIANHRHTGLLASASVGTVPVWTMLAVSVAAVGIVPLI